MHIDIIVVLDFSQKLRYLELRRVMPSVCWWRRGLSCGPVLTLSILLTLIRNYCKLRAPN